MIEVENQLRKLSVLKTPLSLLPSPSPYPYLSPSSSSPLPPLHLIHHLLPILLPPSPHPPPLYLPFPSHPITHSSSSFPPSLTSLLHLPPFYLSASVLHTCLYAASLPACLPLYQPAALPACLSAPLTTQDLEYSFI